MGLQRLVVPGREVGVPSVAFVRSGPSVSFMLSKAGAEVVVRARGSFCEQRDGAKGRRLSQIAGARGGGTSCVRGSPRRMLQQTSGISESGMSICGTKSQRRVFGHKLFSLKP